MQRQRIRRRNERELLGLRKHRHCRREKTGRIDVEYAIVSLERTARLPKEQVEKLRLAGRYDITSFFSKLDAIKGVRGVAVNDVKFQQVWTKVQPLQAQFNVGMFDETSLFNKVLQGMLRRIRPPTTRRGDCSGANFNIGRRSSWPSRCLKPACR